MRKLIFILALTAGSAQANFKQWGCVETCNYLIMEGHYLDYENISGDKLGNRILSSKDKSRFQQSVASATGIGVNAVGGMMTSFRSAARGAGYTKFSATLSGPDGSISFTMNLDSGSWSIHGGPGGGRHDGTGKVRIP